MKHVLKSTLSRASFYLFLSSFSGIALSADIMSLSDRKDRWEVTFQSQYTGSENIDSENGTKVSLNRAWNWGFGVGYNFDEHWALDFDLNWNNANYTGQYVDDNGDTINVSNTLYTNSMQFTGIYNFSAKRFTPFIGASFGWAFIDTNIPTGPAIPGTCWDYWGFPYPCSYQPTLSTTEFTYGASAGLRFDVKDNLFLRLSAGTTWIDYKNTTSTPNFTTYRFDIGLMF